MPQSDPLPAIMAEAKTDLAGNISGDFSPDDWAKILDRAHTQLKASAKSEAEAWTDVIRDFHREKYWGFIPNYVKPKSKPEEHNLGKKFIWFSFRSFLLTKTIILYCGARYVNDDPNPIYTWLFYGALVFIVFAYGRFIWIYARARGEDR